MAKEKDILDKSILTGVKEFVKQNEGDVNNLQGEIDKLRDAVTQGNVRAVSQLTDLLNLIVITYNEGLMLKSGMNEFVGQFIDKPNSNEGNGRRYIKHFATKPKNYDEVKNNFVPTGFNSPKFKVEFLKFKDDNGQLAAGSVQKVWPVVYQQNELITYFINGQLRTFLEEFIISQMETSRNVWLYDYVMTHLTDTNGKGKVVPATGQNMFDAITVDLIPAITQMLQNSADFNVDPTLTESIDASRKEDLIMLIHPETKAQFEANVRSQLFNSGKIDLNNFVGQIHGVNRKFDMSGASDTTVSVTADYYVAKDTIIVIDKRNYWRCINMLSFSGSQSFPLNISNLQVLHEWFAQKHLPWGKVLVYTNPNLLTQP